MQDKKYQIFISSTFADLKDERQAAMNAVIDLRHIPIGMEGFPAIDQEQMSYIRRLIDECDYYVLIVKGRYGSTGTDGISYTEQEFDYALSSGKHILGFLSHDFDETHSDNAIAVRKFRDKVSQNRIVKFWSTIGELEISVLKSLSSAFEVDPREGWVRASAAIDPKMIQELADARSKIQQLEQQLASNLPKQIDNLAGLEDAVTIRFRGQVRYDSSLSDRELTTNWRSLFLAVADQFRVGHMYSAIDPALREFISSKQGTYYHISLTNNERIRILNQFELLGLMKSSVGNSVSGNPGVFYTLTARGDATRLIGNAVLRP